MTKDHEEIEILEVGGPADEPEKTEAARAEATEEGVPEPEEDGGSLVSRLESELEEQRDRSIRTLADFENYRKRITRERQEDFRYAAFDFVQGLLPTMDNLRRALEADGSAEDLKQGVELTLRQMESLLERFGAQRVEAEGEEFDPQVHEAISRVEDPEIDVAMVQQELQPGFTLHDRLLRPAVVTVAMPAEATQDDNEDR